MCLKGSCVLLSLLDLCKIACSSTCIALELCTYILLLLTHGAETVIVSWGELVLSHYPNSGIYIHISAFPTSFSHQLLFSPPFSTLCPKSDIILPLQSPSLHHITRSLLPVPEAKMTGLARRHPLRLQPLKHPSTT